MRKRSTLRTAIYAPGSDACGLGVLEIARMTSLRIMCKKFERFLRRFKKPQGRFETVMRDVIGDPN